MYAGCQAISAGDYHSMVLKKDGSVWTTGRNEYGQLGDGTTNDKNSFVKVVSSGPCGIHAGDGSCAHVSTHAPATTYD